MLLQHVDAVEMKGDVETKCNQMWAQRRYVAKARGTSDEAKETRQRRRDETKDEAIETGQMRRDN